ncbi:MAG: LL-diaminopimelate aminotransferase [Holosporales bacterium]
MQTDFHRISRLPPYVFAEVNRLKLVSRQAGRDVIDFGMGNPDSASPPHVVQKLIETVGDARTHRYSVSRGIHGLRKAQAAYYQRRFNVDLDPDKEIVATLGSKEGLVNLAQAITSPGDVILAPNPCYPIHSFGFMLAGGSIRHLPVDFESDFTVRLIEQIKRAIRHSVPKPTLLVVSYPSNPTAQIVSLDFYEEIVKICKYHNLFILSDLAYAEIYFDSSRKPKSLLEVPGSREIAVEFTTLSKTYSMPGWRVGFAVGSPVLIGALTKIKSYVDYGGFTPVQVAAAAALNGPQDYVDEMRALYKERRDTLVQGLRAAGWEVPLPDASMFVWAPIPPAFRSLGSLAFSKLLLRHADVAVAPGIGFGEYGDCYVRIALVENTQRIRQAVRNIKEFLRRDPAALAAEVTLL